MPYTPNTESDYDPMMPLPFTPISIKGDDEPFEDEEETIEEDEQHDEEFDGKLIDSSPYPDSSFHDDPVERAET